MKVNFKTILPQTPLRKLARPLSSCQEVEETQILKDQIVELKLKLYQEQLINAFHQYLSQVKIRGSELQDLFQDSATYQNEEDSVLFRKLSSMFEVIINDSSVELGYGDQIVFSRQLDE